MKALACAGLVGRARVYGFAFDEMQVEMLVLL